MAPSPGDSPWTHLYRDRRVLRRPKLRHAALSRLSDIVRPLFETKARVLNAPEPLAQLTVSACMIAEFAFTPELHLRDGRIIRDLADAIGFAREQEARPGVDQRDEILHAIERAQTKEQAHAAARRFVRWLEDLDIVRS